MYGFTESRLGTLHDAFIQFICSWWKNEGRGAHNLGPTGLCESHSGRILVRMRLYSEGPNQPEFCVVFFSPSVYSGLPCPTARFWCSFKLSPKRSPRSSIKICRVTVLPKQNQQWAQKYTPAISFSSVTLPFSLLNTYALPPAYSNQKDEREVPGNFLNRTFFCYPSNKSGRSH